MPPIISIIIPAYNRMYEIRRAIDSCLNQSEKNIEVVVVDDASTDETLAIISQYTDPRIKVLRHETNKGFCPARNTGALAASGEWILFLDSDDELLLDVLKKVIARTKDVASDIYRIIFTLVYDDATVSPEPFLPDGCIVDFSEFIRWYTTLTGKIDFAQCIRAEAFNTVKYPEGKAFESEFYYAFAKNFTSSFWQLPVILVHDDAMIRATSPDYAWVMSNAKDNAMSLKNILDNYESDLKRLALPTYVKYLRAAAQWNFIAGDKKAGFSYFAEYVKLRPLWLNGWITVIFGLLSRRLLAWIVVYNGNKH